MKRPLQLFTKTRASPSPTAPENRKKRRSAPSTNESRQFPRNGSHSLDPRDAELHNGSSKKMEIGQCKQGKELAGCANTPFTEIDFISPKAKEASRRKCTSSIATISSEGPVNETHRRLNLSDTGGISHYDVYRGPTLSTTTNKEIAQNFEGATVAACPSVITKIVEPDVVSLAGEKTFGNIEEIELVMPEPCRSEDFDYSVHGPMLKFTLLCRERNLNRMRKYWHIVEVLEKF